MKAQINRSGIKYKHASGVRGKSSLINYTSIYNACNAFFVSRGMDTADCYKPEKKETENDNTEQNQLA